MEPILLNGAWTGASANESFQAHNPATGEVIPGEYPVSTWQDCDRALEAARDAFAIMRRSITAPQRAAFLEAFAANIEARAGELTAIANSETALAVKPRLADVELPRTTTQLRQAAQAARDGAWQQPVIDSQLNIRSCFAPLGPVVVFGPNNFPFAFNGVAGGDFSAAIACGCPVIAKAHPLHPATSRMLAECAFDAVNRTGMPPATLQMLYHLRNEDGLRLVADPRVGATSFTGSRAGGLALKHAADAAGRPIYLEMSSLNPIVFLPGVLAERGEALIGETADSGLAGAGQFCTSPNLLFLVDGAHAQAFVAGLKEAYESRPAAPLLSSAGREGLHRSVRSLIDAGATALTGAAPHEGTAACYRNSVLHLTGAQFLSNAHGLQHEAFGNAITVILCANKEELLRTLTTLEGNLTASIYSAASGEDDVLYLQTAEILRPRCGRLLNDKMPTGVALSPAMNHGGPWPSTGHAGFTSVGIPRSIQRFCALQCYDNVRPHRLPPALQDKASQ